MADQQNLSVSGTCGAAAAAPASPGPAGLRRGFFRERVAIPLALVVLPLLVYGHTVFLRYGLRDDYSTIREACEEPAKLIRFSGSQGRPLYGWLMAFSARQTPTIDDLCWLRAAGAAGLGLLAAAFYLVLRWLQWPACLAAVTAALLVLLPSAQLIASWGVSWPHVMGAWLGLGAFVAVEEGFALAQAWRRVSLLGVALACLLVAALIYQMSAMFYLVGVAAALGGRLGEPLRRQLGWLAWHAFVLGLGLLSAFDVTSRLFAAGIYSRSPRFAIESDLPGKLVWYWREPLPNALALFVLGDVNGRTAVPQAVMMLGLLGLLLAGVLWVRRHHGAAAAWLWLVALVGLPLAAYSISILVAERWASYRTLDACAAVVLVLVMTTLGWWWRARSRRRLCLGVLAVATFLAVLVARWQALNLIALPQRLELRLLEEGAQAIDPAKHPRVFVVTPTQEDTPAALRWGDEFGSLSMDSDWTPKEALKHIMRARFPEMPDVNDRYTYASGGTAPTGVRPDVIIDLRRVREFRGRLE
jgi:hypothetical protein